MRTPEQRAAYDKDTKEKSYSFIRLIQVMLKNFEQYSIPTALIIYMLAFITFMHYKISFLTPSVNKSKEKDNAQEQLLKNCLIIYKDIFKMQRIAHLKIQ